ncbi:hypothetical protein HPB47_007703 [Ixodes persulcatus]|uniref:Uncharacterized protein n=1 Tax=Ixodes persulcatus TaxID=34615 RepID=A0AC60P737_IXOPE|nr:hypothetical protein HPB47_007703 [Ixodes persulcatus]
MIVSCGLDDVDTSFAPPHCLNYTHLQASSHARLDRIYLSCDILQQAHEYDVVTECIPDSFGAVRARTCVCVCDPPWRSRQITKNPRLAAKGKEEKRRGGRARRSDPDDGVCAAPYQSLHSWWQRWDSTLKTVPMSSEEASTAAINTVAEIMANSIGAGVLALGSMVPSFSGEGSDPLWQTFFRRYVLSKGPTSFADAVEAAAAEERNEKLVAPGAALRAVDARDEKNETDLLSQRLDRLEKLFTDNIALQRAPMERGGQQHHRNEERGEAASGGPHGQGN